MNYKYTEIVDYLRGEIEKDSGSGKLPSIRGLAIKFGCSNSTVIKAYSELESLGLVFSAPKSGYYIHRNPREHAETADFYSGVPSSRNLPLDSLARATTLTMEEKNSSLLNYSYPMGYNLLREHLLLELHQPDLALDSVLITSGAQSALSLFFETEKSWGKVLVEDPTYNIALSMLELQEIPYDMVRRTREGLDLEAMEEKLKTEKYRLFYTMSRNHNPLGTDLSPETMARVVDLSRTYGFYILEDDYLAELSKGPTFFSMAPDRTIYVRSYSKTISPALKLAHVIMPPAWIKSIGYRVTYLNLSASLLHQAVLLKYLKSEMYPKDMVRLKEKVKQNIMIFRNAVADFPFDLHVPELGFFASLHFPADFKLEALLENLQAKGHRFRDFTGFTRSEDKVLRVSLTRVEPDTVNASIRELVREVHLMRGEKDDKNKIYL